METRIGPDLRKPFRGLTTIQLFDKNTGELLEEYHDENTYNDRLQYINYLDTVLKCKGPNIVSTISPFKYVSSDDAYSSFLRQYYGSRIGSSSSVDVRQLFATLWLTNSTKAETAHGYPNGIPVGIADAAGLNATFVANAYTGLLNTSESYVGNDRLHLVFDFATDKCNVQFDALWLFPSIIRQSSNDTASYAYNISTFYQNVPIAEETVDTQLLFKYPYFNRNFKINGNYTVLGYHTSYYESRYSPYAVQILNNLTGEIVSTVDFNTEKAIYMPFYYDAGSDTLYTLCTSSYAAPYEILGQSNTAYSLCKLNMSTGEVSRVDTLYNLLGLRFSDLGLVASNDSSSFSFLHAYKKDGGVANILKVRGKSTADGSLKNYYIVFNFDSTTETFTQVTKLEEFNNTNWTPASMFLIDNIAYIPYPIKANQQTGYTYSAFDITTGVIKSTNVMSASSYLNHIGILGRYYGYDNGNAGLHYLMYDQAIYKRPICETSSNYSTSGVTLNKTTYFTAPWSTHNKLTSAIKKTDLTTMKIQYDIVWDSIPDVILPALL